jgi:hypothetical protein
MSEMILSSVRAGFLGVLFIVVIVEGTKQPVNKHIVMTMASQVKHLAFIVVSLSLLPGLLPQTSGKLRDARRINKAV